jgi:hypothetical protein
MEIDIEACFKYIQTNAQKLGHAKGELVRIEAKVKAIKAALMNDSAASSIAMKEADSYQHIEYLKVVQELADATALETELSIMVKAAFQKVETHRALEYTRRAEIKNGI